MKSNQCEHSPGCFVTVTLLCHYVSLINLVFSSYNTLYYTLGGFDILNFRRDIAITTHTRDIGLNSLFTPI